MPSCERDDCPSCPVDDAKDCGYLAAEQRGAARVLREIAKMPSPWEYQAHGGYWDGHTEIRWRCRWCDAIGTDPLEAGRWEQLKWTPPAFAHPDNGCLYVRALAAGRDEAR